ncbi:hypothetical protein NEOLEDRAFT_719713 [Neolentinus lepideus HHB14362 ss-1]|uniref:Mediator of RNA polymerase II transcription subunit 8 n=1 Tax=Neolentinus lepideus HHB14362 ss-1 TaxID=1314782 RepID=A0A165Q5Y6_9AGAM|nr:hypothetical protein NEOLEDRAFT_719713 [Neolentinus lepideus HHB14362 ss-1]
MSQPQSALNTAIPASATLPALTFDPSALPTGQLESLRFRTTQIIESIQSLQRTLEAGGQNIMPAWPDILSRYNILLSQTHNLSSTLVGHVSAPAEGGQENVNTTRPENPYEKIALHPSKPLTDAQLDNELIPLLRNQQTTDVLRQENETVRRLSEHMSTKGSVGVLTPQGQPQKTDYNAVLAECKQIRVEHDQRIERAVRAVNMLREKYDWKARVAVDQEEPDEIDWGEPTTSQGDETNGGKEPTSEDDDEMEMEDVLGEVNGTPDGSDTTPGTPAGASS